jgi:hypothetical protein
MGQGRFASVKSGLYEYALSLEFAAVSPIEKSRNVPNMAGVLGPVGNYPRLVDMKHDMLVLAVRGSGNDIILSPFSFQSSVDTVILVVFCGEGLVGVINAFNADQHSLSFEDLAFAAATAKEVQRHGCPSVL